MDKFKEIVPSKVRDYVAFGALAFGGCTVLIRVSGAITGWISEKRLQRRWASTPKDVVILHAIPPALACPNASPFVLKLETYMRMTNIPYQIDLGDPMGPKGKTPWISFNGETVSDSQLCIEFLAKKFNKRVGRYSEEDRAKSTMARIMMDEHFYWGLLTWRYVFSSKKGYGPEHVFAMPKLLLKIFLVIYGRKIHLSNWLQGIGRHSEEQITQIMCDDLRAISKVLGKKKFILGDEPCEDDCAIFGEVAQALWCMPGSPYEKLVNDELQNLKEYCLRMKDLYWPDWDDCLAKK